MGLKNDSQNSNYLKNVVGVLIMKKCHVFKWLQNVIVSKSALWSNWFELKRWMTWYFCMKSDSYIKHNKYIAPAHIHKISKHLVFVISANFYLSTVFNKTNHSIINQHIKKTLNSLILNNSELNFWLKNDSFSYP